MYGTTLRIFDPDIGGWHIIWSDPLNQDYSRQIGRADGKDIVQIGDDSRGLKARWRFTEITTDSFHWIGEERSSNSDPWQVTYEHFARRTDPSYFVGTESGTPALRALWSFCMDWQAGLHISGELMFDHVKFGASDYSASKAFFLKALEPLGVAVVSEGPPTYGVELSPKGKASLCLYQTEEKPAHLHLAFAAENRRQVEAFYRAALEAGGKDNGAPGLRPHYHANYYAAFVIGPDGHNIEVVCHEPEA